MHVDLTYSGVERLGNRQLTRRHYADVVENLAALGAAAQVWDIVFALETTPADDAALAAAVRAAANAHVGMTVDTTGRGSGTAFPRDVVAAVQAAALWDMRVDGPATAVEPATPQLASFASLTAAARGVGFLNVIADADGVFRRVPLVYRWGDGFIPSLALRAARDYLKVPAGGVVLEPGREIRFSGATLPDTGARADITIPLAADNTYRVNYAGPWEAMRHRPFEEVWRAARDPLAAALLRDALSGRVAVVADLSSGGSDVGPVPTDERYPLAGIHATVIDNIVSRAFVREARWPARAAVELILLVAASLLLARTPPRAMVLSASLLAALYVAVAVAAFISLHVILSVVRPLIALGIAAIAVGTYRLFVQSRDTAILRYAFQAYFPPAVVDRIVQDPSLVTAAGEKKELTILFSDIVSFTSRCEQIPPDEVRSFLNRYFAAMVDIVFEHGGTVDKFIGDGLMVFFGDPEPQADHALRAVRTAIAMQREVARLNEEMARAEERGFQVRIGVSTGPVVVGNMGSARRLSYTVLGAAVNLAQRLESSAPPGGILISARTYESLRGEVAAHSAGAIALKGLAQTVPAYEVRVGAGV